jgi:hypothetical protein
LMCCPQLLVALTQCSMMFGLIVSDLELLPVLMQGVPFGPVWRLLSWFESAKIPLVERPFGEENMFPVDWTFCA